MSRILKIFSMPLALTLPLLGFLEILLNWKKMFGLLLIFLLFAGDDPHAGMFGIIIIPIIAITILLAPPFISLWLYWRQRRKPIEKRSYLVSIVISLFYLAVTFHVNESLDREFNPNAAQLKERGILSSPPPGFLVPTKQSIPNGYQESSHAFQKNGYIITYQVPNDTVRDNLHKLELIFDELSDSCQFRETPNFKGQTLQDFTYENAPGIIRFNTAIVNSASMVNYSLTWQDSDKCFYIEWKYTQGIEPNDVIALLSTLARAQ